jgi:hypothetical protein
MASNSAITAALERIGHRWKRSSAWQSAEAGEWRRHGTIQAASDDWLEAGVTKFVALPGSYALQILIDLLRQGRASVDAGCPCCVSGWVEVAVWRGHRVTEAVIACSTCKKGMALDAVAQGWREKDSRITDIIMSVDHGGRYRPMSLAERGRRPA